MIRQNSTFLLVTGDFNARSSSWWKNDWVTREGKDIESLTCSYGLRQLISDPTHILKNSSSCIYLIFTCTLPGILTAIVRLYFRKSIQKSNTHHFMNGYYGIKKMQFHNQSIKQLNCLTGKNYFKTKTFTINLNFSMKQ